MFNVFKRKYFWGEMFNVFKSECAESPLESTRCFCRNQLSALLLNSFGPKKPWSLSLSLSFYVCIFVHVCLFFSYTFSCNFFSLCKFVFFFIELYAHAFVFGVANLAQFPITYFIFLHLNSNNAFTM